MEATEECGVRIDMAPGELLQQFVEAMKQNLRDHDAPNYVETRFVDRNTGEEWVLLVQRSEGLTPGNKAHLEKVRADRYQKVLEKIAKPLGDGCGCGGPTCHCFTPEAIRVEAEARIDLAAAAIKE